MYVQHLKNTRNCPKGKHGVSSQNWIVQWENFTGLLRGEICFGCNNKSANIYGCHVIQPYSAKRYIIPMCKNCNERRYGEWIKMPFIHMLELNENCKCGYPETLTPPEVGGETRKMVLSGDTNGGHTSGDTSGGYISGDTEITRTSETRYVIPTAEEMQDATTTAGFIAKPMVDMATENMKTKGGRAGGWIAGGVMGVICLIVLIVVIVCVAIWGGPPGWIIGAVVIAMLCTAFGCCAGSAVGKGVNDERV